MKNKQIVKVETKTKQNKFVLFWSKTKSWIKNWSAWAKNKTINALIFFFALFIMMGMNYCFIIGAWMPKFFILDMFLILLSISPIFFFRKTIFDLIWIPIILLFSVVVACINVNYYKFFNSILAIKDIKMAIENIGQATTRVGDLNWLNIGLNIGLYLIFIAGLFVFNIRFKFVDSKNRSPRSRKSITVFASIFMLSSLVTYEFTMGMWVISQKAKGVDSIKFVNYNTNYHVKNLGLMNYYNREIRQILFEDAASDNEIIDYLNQAKHVKNNYSGSLVSESNSLPNVFMIMIETGDRLMAHPETTPTLWQFFKESGIYGQHNFSYNHTNISNVIGLTGSYPSFIFNQRADYAIPFSLPKILNKYNYDTRFYYDITGTQDAYGDMSFMRKIGFKNCFYHDDLLPGVEPWHYNYDNFIRDTVVMDAILKNLKDIDTSKNFFSYWMTMHMHMDNRRTKYNTKDIDSLYEDYGPKLRQLESEGKWQNPYTGGEEKTRYEIYTLKTMDFDAALTKLTDFLYKSDDKNLQNTLLVAYGDHFWFESVNGKLIVRDVKKVNDFQNINLYSSILGLYHPTLTQMINDDDTGLFNGHDINKLTSPAAVLPTILDLLNIPYNNMICSEKSIFDLDGKEKYDTKATESYYSNILGFYMNEHYYSLDGNSISGIINDNGTKDEFIKRTKEKQKQLRLLTQIYRGRFFNRYNYDDFVPIIN